MSAVEPKPPRRWKKGQSGNPAGRPAGSDRVRALLDPHYDALVQKAVDLALRGDTVALRICIDRLAPPPRAESSMVRIPGIAAASTFTEKANALVNAVGRGEISPDSAALLLGAIANAARIMETDELAKRISALEVHGLV